MATITLTNASNGESIKCRQDDEIILRLSENPTTGYRWHIVRADGLVQEADAYRPPPDPQFGSGGVREFRFRAKVTGEGRLELKRWREWEGEKSVLERFAIDIKIAS
jgi:inhibitor of cysteine peptidase